MKKIKIIEYTVITMIGVCLYLPASAQTNSQNYIKTTTYTNYANNNASDSLVTVQYFDGLGRPIQTVQKGITPNGYDLVAFQEYDAFGRESNSWLPAVAAGNNGAFIALAAFKTNATATYNSTAYSPYPDSIPYSRPVYEASPLNRITEQYGPGADWQKNSKSIKTGYLTNKAKSGTAWVDADSLVCGRYISTDDGKTVSLYRTDNYAANELYVTRIKDEDGNTSYEFKDKLGQVVLTRQINAGKSFDTNYIYDCFGNLRAVLPPEGSTRLLSAASTAAWTETNGDLKLYAYLYKYDSRNRCIAKKLPGCEWIYYVYDKADRLIFTQDSVQRITQRWTFSIPDSLGRIAVTGTYKNITMKYSDDPLKNSLVVAGRTKATNSFKGYTIYGVTIGSSTDSLTILTVNYYDNYDFMGNNSIPANTDVNIKYNDEGYGKWYAGDYTEANKYKNKGLLTGTLTAQMNPDGTVSSTYLYSVMYYDYRGRLVQTKSNNHLTGGIDKEYFAYNFTGQPTGRKHIHLANGKTTQEIYVNSYDHAGRLKNTTHQYNSGTVTTIAENTYDELGRLKTNKKGGQANLNITYAYNIRSWLKSITSPLFAQTLYYNEPFDTSTKSYSGNISTMSWKHSDEANTYIYQFEYDNLSRLTVAYSDCNLETNRHRTTYSYDKQGNMLYLTRDGKTSATTFGSIDKLTMSYTGNQLKKVEDTGTNVTLAESADFKNYSNVATEYTYNANGAMTQDLNKGISDIQYNVLNLPRLMDIKSPVAEARNEYTYAADGRKLKLFQKWNSNYSTAPVIGSAINTSLLKISQTTDYIGNMIYRNGYLTRILIDGGYFEVDCDMPGGGTYHYYLTDHQGNNRLVVTSSGSIAQKNNYYPDGMAFQDGTFPNSQPYKYNNKELDRLHGLNQYDYSARYYDPAIVRFTTMDPLAEKYYSISPYAYCLNNPIKYVDPDGEIPVLSFVAGFVRGLAGGSNFRESLSIGWKTEKNSWKLTGGLFIADTKKSFFGKVGQIASRLTYELPQTLIGLGMGYVSNMGWDVDVNYYAGATATTVLNKEFGGVTMGSYILGDKNLNVSPSDALFQHEYGHYLQSQLSGWLYSFIFGLPSLYNAMTTDYEGHTKHFSEQDANKRSHRYLTKRDKNFKDWDSELNPVYPNPKIPHQYTPIPVSPPLTKIPEHCIGCGADFPWIKPSFIPKK